MMWTWSLQSRRLLLGERTHVMGVVNVTPDSFSDGGRFVSPTLALDHARTLVTAGADVLDVGGESTRPGAAPVPADEEVARVVPVIEALAGPREPPVSVDTRSADVARRALAAGAEIVNDVSALRHDPEMASVVADAGAGVVLMHMRGDPQTMQRSPRYDDVVDEVAEFFEERLTACVRAGIRESSIVLDPGIGFGKRLDHNLELLARSDVFHRLGRPVLIGTSRKSMFGDLLGVDVDQRLVPSAAAVALSAFLGVAMVRVHDVRECRWAAEIGTATRRARAGGAPTGAS